MTSVPGGSRSCSLQCSSSRPNVSRPRCARSVETALSRSCGGIAAGLRRAWRNSDGDRPRAAAVCVTAEAKAKVSTAATLAERPDDSRDRLAALITAPQNQRFAQVMGESPGHYQKRRRLEWASAAIYQGEQSLKQIADELGFCDVFHFSKAFKQEMGLTPSDYRKRVRGA